MFFRYLCLESVSYTLLLIQQGAVQFCLILFCVETVFTLVKSDFILLSTGKYVLVKDCKIFIP